MSICTCLISAYWPREKNMVFPYDILVLTNSVAMNNNKYSVVCGINLILWVVFSLQFQLLDRNHLSDMPGNLLKMPLSSSCYFQLTLTQDSTSMAYMTPKTMMMIIPQYLISMSSSQYFLWIIIFCTTTQMVRRNSSWRTSVRKGCK